MHKIAQSVLEAQNRTAKWPDRSVLSGWLKKYAALLILGLLSIGLYTELSIFDATLVQLAQATHAGHKELFFVPILLALLFSFVHGAFASRFWDVLGVKPRPKAAE